MGNKAIIITGANGAIGSVLTAEYLKKNYHVIALVHRNIGRLTQLLQDYPDNLLIEKCDLTDFQQLASLVKKLRESEKGLPSKVIHTSAVRSSDFLPLAETDPRKWYSVVNNNLFSTYNLLRNLLPYYQEKEEGRIVLIGSNISRTGLKFGSAYAVSKGALGNLARTIALEYGKYNIMINIISPGPVDADQSHFSEEYQKFRESYFAKELENTPLKKLVKAQDILETCDFLLSAKNRLITGEEIFITGGKL
jgi:NAD(P)-dependent dehydrogenase (short-subunit alcohol dehydrogenase family)